ncbi:hypothetical protein YC2023_084421 [Brassica napus]
MRLIFITEYGYRGYNTILSYHSNREIKNYKGFKQKKKKNYEGDGPIFSVNIIDAMDTMLSLSPLQALSLSSLNPRRWSRVVVLGSRLSCSLVLDLFRSNLRDSLELVKYAEGEYQSWFNAYESTPLPPQEHPNQEQQVLSSDNICMVDGS